MNLQPKPKMRKAPKDQAPIIVGWREMVALPAWDIPSIRAKIDTGARTSAIDVDRIEKISPERIRFEVVMSNKHRRQRKWVTAEIVREAVVKSSNGKRETRYVVATTLELGGHCRSTEFTLVRRSNMLCRMLIGRSALQKSYLVDATRAYLASTKPIRRKTPLHENRIAQP